jgi:hypothetical protein
MKPETAEAFKKVGSMGCAISCLGMMALFLLIVIIAIL